MKEVLCASGLTKTYGETIALQDLSFSAREGEILGLLGPNGAGKTTAIRIIMGIIEPDGGSFSLAEADGEKQGRSMIGYLPEERGLYGEARVVDNLIYLAQLHGVDKNKARSEAGKWLKRMQLSEWSDKKLEQLSKGMQQKVQFIAAVLHRPRLVVLDEPFAGLDPINQDVFRQEIFHMQERGVSIVLSSHQMNLVEELCDRICMLHEGRRVIYGRLRNIKRRFPIVSVQIVHGENADMSFLQAVDGVSGLHTDSGKTSFRYRSGQDINQLINRISSRLQIQEISIETPPLHDIFTSIVEQGGDVVAAANIT